ncbi:hypothetical protein [Streptomyces sp. NPDC002952]|uniref:hypothetical protein n=1 Tax=Streptomyces sp. NPDC002952 TaxID=3364673 RepID=UPI0036B29ECB
MHGLIAMGLLRQVPDPDSARRRLIRTTTEGRRVHERAQAAIAVVESVLADGIGRAGADALRQALTADWGRPPFDPAP